MVRYIKAFFTKKGIDKPILISTLILVLFGVIMIGSASIGAVSTKGAGSVIKNMLFQAIYAIAGIIVMTALTKMFNTKIVNYKFCKILYGVGIVSLLICLNWNIKGAHAWIKLGPITVQPAEFMKLGMILILSFFLTETDKAFVVKGRFRTQEIKEQFYKEKFYKCVGIPLVLIVVIFLVVAFVQSDLGTAIILGSICFICLMVTPRAYYGKYKRMAGWLIGVGFVVIVFLSTTFLKGYQMARITTWLHPLENIYSTSWQLVNSMIAFTGGGLFGLGFGNSIQKYDYIPEAHNDFIGAIIYEELGIFGLAMILIPTCIIIFRLLKYADKINEEKSKIILIGVASYFLLHLLVNLGGVSGLIPMTGVPILLISAGGSSTVSALISIGICQAIISKYNKSLLNRNSTR